MSHPDKVHLTFDYTQVSEQSDSTHIHPFIAAHTITLRSITLLKMLSRLDIDQLDSVQQEKIQEIYELIEKLDK